MSSMDKAKKQAKRLFDFAKTKSLNNKDISLPLPNLNTAFDIISKINGYKNWHEYRLNLERSDMLANKINKKEAHNKQKSILENKDYFLQDIPLITINSTTNDKESLFINKEHIPITIGYDGIKGGKKTKGWILNQYPFYIQSDTGAGREETVLSFADEYLKNNEGLIYLDVKGYSAAYLKFFTFAKRINRIQDIYAFYLHDKEAKERGVLTHTIDPINPMWKYPEYFENVFGKEIGAVIHTILGTVHNDNKLLTVNSLPAFIMLKNIINWNDKNLPAIDKYLKKIGYKDNINDDVLEKHIIFCEQAYTVINQLIKFEHCFSHEPNIDLMKIFKERKILIAQIDNINYHMRDTIGPLKCIYQGILSTDKYLTENGYGHCQNIILNECSQYLNEEREINNISIIKESKNNYILSNYSLLNENKNMSSLLEVSKTFASMKVSGIGISIPFYIKINAVNNMPNLSPIFYANENKHKKEYQKYHLHDIREGEMYIFCNNYQSNEDKKVINNSCQYYIEKITAIYNKQNSDECAYLVKHN